MNYGLIIFSLCLDAMISKIDAQDILWTRRFNQGQNEEAGNSASDLYDNVIIVGTSHDTLISKILLLKYNQNGDLLWHRIYGACQYNWGFCLATDSIGNIIVASYHNDLTIEKPGLTKFSANGETIWSRMYSILANFWITGICLDSQNNIYVCGMRTTNPISLIAKFDTIGNILWYRTYCWGYTQTFKDIILDRYRNIYVVGDLDYGPWVLLLAKFNSNGDTIWTRHYSENNQMCDGGQLLLDTSNNIIIAGYVGSGVSDALILKYSNSGNLIWNRRIDYHSFDWLSRVSIDNYNNIFVSGSSGQSLNNCDYLLIKLSPSGETLWTRFYNAGYDDNSAGVVVDRQNNPIVTGRSSNGADYDVLTIKYSGSSGSEESISKPIPKEISIKLCSNIITNQQISLAVLKPNNYKISVYDIQGRLINIVHDGFIKQGIYFFNLGPISNSIYFLEIKTEKHKQVQKLIINK